MELYYVKEEKRNTDKFQIILSKRRYFLSKKPHRCYNDRGRRINESRAQYNIYTVVIAVKLLYYVIRSHVFVNFLREGCKNGGRATRVSRTSTTIAHVCVL